LIVVRNLIFDYPTKRALRSVSFEIQAGTITGLVGPNGAGKTTLMRCLAGLDVPTSGSITLNRVDVVENPREAHRHLGLLHDYLGLYEDLTARQCLTYAAASRGINPSEIPKRVVDTVTRFAIADKLDEKVANLSRGQRQRIAIAQAMIHRPRVIMLDEPAAGLDPDARASLSLLLRTLEAEGMTLLVSSHILAELEDYTTHMMILRNGRIVEHCPTRAPVGKPRRLKLVLAQPSAQLRTALTAAAAVSALDIEGLSARFDFSGDLTAQAGFLQGLIAAGLPVAGLQEEPRSMQAVYVEKMRGPKR